MRIFAQLLKTFKSSGFDYIAHETESPMIELRMDGVVNPADIRTKAAGALSDAGFQGYYLMEVYYYEKSKYPYRTDQYGYVEFRPGADFNRITMTITKRQA